MSDWDLAGIAAVVAAVGGLVTPFLSAWLILKVREVHVLTNNNFSQLQETLNKSLQRNAEQEERATAVAAEVEKRARVNKSHMTAQEITIEDPEVVNIEVPRKRGEERN